MGDVVHAVPVVEDIKRFISDAEIDWLVEDSFADIPRHVAGVSEVIECSVRKWKKRIFEKSTRGQIKALCEKLRSKHYDLVIDLQGLIKSAVLASWTNAPVAGYFRLLRIRRTPSPAVRRKLVQGGRGEVGARHKERTYSTNKKTHQNGTTGCIKYQYFVSLYGNKILSLQH